MEVSSVIGEKVQNPGSAEHNPNPAFLFKKNSHLMVPLRVHVDLFANYNGKHL